MVISFAMRDVAESVAMHLLGVWMATSGLMGLLYVGLLTQGCDPLEMLDGKPYIGLGLADGPASCRLETFAAAADVVQATVAPAPAEAEAPDAIPQS
jgi:hypothetical protein